MYIHDFNTLCEAIMLSGCLMGAVLFMREILQMKSIYIFCVITFHIIAIYLTTTYGFSSY